METTIFFGITMELSGMSIVANLSYIVTNL